MRHAIPRLAGLLPLIGLIAGCGNAQTPQPSPSRAKVSIDPSAARQRKEYETVRGSCFKRWRTLTCRAGSEETAKKSHPVITARSISMALYRRKVRLTLEKMLRRRFGQTAGSRSTPGAPTRACSPVAPGRFSSRAQTHLSWVPMARCFTNSRSKPTARGTCSSGKTIGGTAVKYRNDSDRPWPAARLRDPTPTALASVDRCH